MIYKAKEKDISAVLALARKLWANADAKQLEKDIASYVYGEETDVFLYDENGKPAGFAMFSVRRDYVEGSESSPVGYLEGIFIEDSFRKKGIARRLVKACETRARELGCEEFASDCELWNTDSLAFHLAVGFEEANRIICFIKKI